MLLLLLLELVVVELRGLGLKLRLLRELLKLLELLQLRVLLHVLLHARVQVARRSSQR